MNTIPCYWYQNLQQHYAEPLNLTATYDPLLYQTYDNYSAIEVSRTKDIPKDYFGVMGVPVRYIAKFNPQQFEIVGEARHGSDGPLDLFKPFVNGREKYTRLLIRRKQ